MWNCPACQLPLTLADHSWRCEQGHSYDKAKEGYVNLLLAQHKKSKEPGDNKQMINARRLFLENGYYQPLAEKLYELLVKHGEDSAMSLFDAGCGEGYYLGFLHNKLLQNGLNVESAGCDISKVAIQKAAKKHKACEFSVASTFKLPVGQQSQTAVIQVFAPSSDKEVWQALKPGGIWIQADPGFEHLQQLKAKVYQNSLEHQEKPTVVDGFECLAVEQLHFNISLENQQDRHNLLLMTPFYWSASEQARVTLEQELVDVTCHFQLRVFKKVEIAQHG